MFRPRCHRHGGLDISGAGGDRLVLPAAARLIDIIASAPLALLRRSPLSSRADPGNVDPRYTVMIMERADQGLCISCQPLPFSVDDAEISATGYGRRSTRQAEPEGCLASDIQRSGKYDDLLDRRSAHGAYSVLDAGGGRGAASPWLEPVADRLFAAGEATVARSPSTAHGAWQSWAGDAAVAAGGCAQRSHAG